MKLYKKVMHSIQRNYLIYRNALIRWVKYIEKYQNLLIKKKRKNLLVACRILNLIETKNQLIEYFKKY